MIATPFIASKLSTASNVSFGKNGHTVESYFNSGKILGTQNISVGDQLDHVQNHIGILIPDL